ncbi:MAG: hypothetical protein ACR2RF_14775 [Geminicoccaceae bacterium]
MSNGANGSSEDPLVSLVRQYRRLRVELKPGSKIDEMETRMALLRERIIETPAQSLDGVLGHFHVLKDMIWNNTMKRLIEQLEREIIQLWSFEGGSK